MKLVKYPILICSIAILTSVSFAAPNLPAAFTTMQELRKQNKVDEAITVGETYLNLHPKDADVLLLMGLLYYQKGNHALAEKYYKKTLNISPNYFDAKVALFRAYVAMQKYRQAEDMLNQIARAKPNYRELKNLQAFLNRAKNAKELQKIDAAIKQDKLDAANKLIEQSLLLHPNDPDFMNKQADLYLARHQYAMAAQVDKKILRQIDPNNAAAKAAFKSLKDLNPHILYGVNEAGFNSEIDHVTYLNTTWQYSTLYYSRAGERGKMILSVNNASRFGHNASQAMVNLYPVLNSHMYLNLEGGFAQQPILFPKVFAGAEAFLAGNLAEVSAGFRNSTILAPSIAFAQYTGSIAKEWQNFLVSFRPYYYIPINGDNSLLYTLTFAKFFATRDFFAKVVLGSGTSPNLADLLTVDFIVVSNNFITGEIQFPLYKHMFSCNVGWDYQHWVFPDKRVWNISGIVFGLNM